MQRDCELYGGFAGYEEDIQRFRLKAESLKTPLKRLRDLVEDTRLSDPKIANNIHEKR